MLNSMHEPTRPETRARSLLVAVPVTLTALLGVAIAQRLDRLDSALVFVGIPCLLALGLGLLPTKRSWGSIFQFITVVLLLASALLQEGALCVLMAAPLVYGVAALAWFAARTSKDGERLHALALLPLLLLMSEGIAPDWRIAPEATARAERAVGATCADFERALDRGPRISSDDRGTLLSWARYPTPISVTGTGVHAGDEWVWTMPGGDIHAGVVSEAVGLLRFEVTGDNSGVTRWVTLRSATLSWSQQAQGCRAIVTIDYQRHLDPALWFGPITAAFMNAGADALLASLD